MNKIFSIHKNKIILDDNTVSANPNAVMTFIKNTLGVNIIEGPTVDRVYLDKYANLRVRAIVKDTPTDELLYKFGLLSDTHIDGDETDTAYSISDLNNAIQFFNNENCDFIAYAGDMTENDRVVDYTALKTCLGTSSIPNYCVRGNHDISNNYSDATGCENDYTITKGNDLFIFLSPTDSSQTTGGLTTAKLDWLENLLQTNTNKRIFLIYHYFINNTAGNANNLDNGAIPCTSGVTLRFKNIIESYSNLIFCNGHSHLRFSLQDLDPNANYYHEEGKCYYVHVPSASRPRGDNGSGGTTNIYGGSEGYLVEVYADKVVFKPIDFIGNQYLSKYNYTVNVPQDKIVGGGKLTSGEIEKKKEQ